MWIFGYGSLMWDGWEQPFGCVRHIVANLKGYRREFNKASVRNWGTNNAPCPTLNLISDDSAICVGMAFEFPEENHKKVIAYLRKREGPSFNLNVCTIQTTDVSNVEVLVPIYIGNNLITDKSIEEKAKLAKATSGTDGRCADYIKGIFHKLSELGIDDPSVTEFWEQIDK